MSLLLLAGTASCASSGSSPDSGIPAPRERIVATDNHATYRTTVAPNPKVSLPVTQARAFEAVKAVYADLGVPTGVNDPTTGRIGNTNFWKLRKLGNEALSTYLSCGDSFTGPAADNYRVYISLISAVRPNGTAASELETSFTAQAQNMEGTAGDRVACGTTGRLEERIRRAVLLKVGTTP
jgi:hypothetical protein